MRIVIPISEGQTVPINVRKSLELQTLEVDIHIVTNPVRYIPPEKYQDVREEMEKRYSIIGKSRNMCLPILQEEEIAVMNDSTLRHLDKNNLKDMLDVLESDQNVVAVGLPINTRFWFKIEHAHIQNGCIMARKKVWETVSFNQRRECQCTCSAFAEQVRLLGSYRFVDLRNDRVKKH
jgi:hypothetical protein